MQPNDQTHITQEDITQGLDKEPTSKKFLQIEKKMHPQLKKTKTRNTIIDQHEDEDLIFEQIRQSRFKQQRLPAWRPVPTIKSIFIVFFSFGLIFIMFGIILLVYSKKIKEIEIDYTDCELNDICNIEIRINETINNPIYIYYQLDGFYQNARRYVKSKNIDQLRGRSDSTDDCNHFETNEKMDLWTTKSISGENLDMKENAIPCGLIAKSLFNDTYNFSINNEEIIVDETDISYAKDRDLYKENKYPDKQWHDITDEHFLVWMRISGLPDPRKIWGKIDRDLKEGEILNVTINNNYNVSAYDGKKKIILSNVTNLGGNNIFLAYAYIIMGSLSLLCSIVFPIGNKIQMAKEKQS